MTTIRILAFIASALFSVTALVADSPKVGDNAADFTLQDLAGQKVKLSDLTAKGSVVVVVLRGYPGYQCPICSKQFGNLIGHAEDFKKAGVDVMLIYPGPSEKLQDRAKEFIKGKDYPAHFHLLIDPDYSFTRAYNLRWEAKNETAYPSTFVIDGKNKIQFAKVSKTHGDRADPKDILKAIQTK
jgi:peroxiredoxin